MSAALQLTGTGAAMISAIPVTCAYSSRPHIFGRRQGGTQRLQLLYFIKIKTVILILRSSKA